MKTKILLLLLIVASFAGFAQTQNALPVGSIPYGTQYYIAPDASVWVGTTAKKFRRITETKTLDSLLTVLNANVLHTTGTETKTGRLILTSPSPAQAPTGGTAIAPLTVTGANGGNSTATSGTGTGGSANEMVFQGGSGGNVSLMTTGTAISGSGAAMTFRGGDGGNISGTPTSKIFGNGGTPVIQGGSAYGTGASGDVEIKSGNNVTAGSLVRGGNVFLTTGWGNNDPSDNPLYNGTLFLNVTRSLAVRGNTVIGNAVDDYSNRLQVTGNTKITGKATVTVAPTAAQDVVRKQELDAVAAGSVTNLAIGTVTTTTVPVTNSNGTGFTIPGATTSLAGVMSSADKTKLNGIATGATANQTDAFLLARANHTGTQAISTVTGLQTALDSKINLTEKGAVNGIATLGADGKIPNGQVPSIALTETFVVASQAAMLALSQAEMGDVAVRTDINKSFILQQVPASTLANWIELLSPSLGNTDNLPEGTTNLYFTQARARASVSGGTGISYSSGTGVITNSAPNVQSNLAVGARTTTTVPITNSDGTGATLPVATTSLAGVMSSADKTKLDGIAAGANTGTVTSVGLTAPTGLTVSGSPVTTSGTLGLSYTAGYAIPTTAKQTDWDTAFGWGDYRQFGLGASALTTDYNTAPSYTFLRNNNLSTPNAPTAGVHSVWTTGNALNLNASGQGAQLALGYSNAGGNYAPPEIYLRSKIAITTWGSWYKVFSEANFTPGNYVLKSGDVMTGNLTAPTFTGALSGNASSASTASFSTTAAAGDNSVKIATTQFVQQELGGYLPLTAGTGFPLTGELQVNKSAAGITLKNIAGATGNTYMQFQNNAGTRLGYIGLPSVANNNMAITADLAAITYNGTSHIFNSQITGTTAVLSGNYTGNNGIATGATGTNRGFYSQTNGTHRWSVVSDSNPESGSNSGSNFSVNRFDDAGTLLGSALNISRATGASTFSGAISGTSADFSSTLTGTTSVAVNGAAATTRAFSIRTGGLNRWLMYGDSGAESGSNAGSSFNISRYSDAGAFLGTPINIIRSTGAITVESTISAATAPTTGNHLTNKIYVDAQSVVGAFDEGNGIGYRLRSSNPSFYGNIGLGAVDFTSATGGTTFGATGDYSFSSGQTTTASGTGSTALGNGSSASGISAVAMGNLTQANGVASVAMGNAVIMGTDNGFGFGQYNDNTGGHIFTIGNGPNGASRSNAYDLTSTGNSRQSGTATATQFRVSALNTAPASATAAGTLGEIRITATHIYICTATNTWVRAALATW